MKNVSFMFLVFITLCLAILGVKGFSTPAPVPVPGGCSEIPGIIGIEIDAPGCTEVKECSGSPEDCFVAGDDDKDVNCWMTVTISNQRVDTAAKTVSFNLSWWGSCSQTEPMPGSHGGYKIQWWFTGPPPSTTVPVGGCYTSPTQSGGLSAVSSIPQSGGKYASHYKITAHAWCLGLPRPPHATASPFNGAKTPTGL